MLYRTVFLLSAASSCSGFLLAPSAASVRAPCRVGPLVCQEADETPSDVVMEVAEELTGVVVEVEEEQQSPPADSVSAAASTADAPPVDIESISEVPTIVTLKTELLSVAAGCTRGESATEDDIVRIRTLVSDLEQLSPIAEPTLAPEAKGTWELVATDTQLFRSSPFFMAGRAVCADGDEARRYDWFCDMHRAALAISTIGKVRQIVSSDAIVSEFEVSAGAVPFLSDYTPFSYSGGLPFTINGAIVSSATIESNLGDAYRLLMDTVEIKGSNIPGLRQALDAGVRLQTRELGKTLESVVPTYANPTPLFKTTYLDESLRISRDQDGKLFVYAKVSGDTSPTDYADAPSDFGIGKLLEGISSSLL